LRHKGVKNIKNANLVLVVASLATVLTIGSLAFSVQAGPQTYGHMDHMEHMYGFGSMDHTNHMEHMHGYHTQESGHYHNSGQFSVSEMPCH
ncbi:MAG: hypothetical protein ABEJ72_02100, partial [Candidatus Aenigmatarchaeota archaeon]